MENQRAKRVRPRKLYPHRITISLSDEDYNMLNHLSECFEQSKSETNRQAFYALGNPQVYDYGLDR